MATRHPIAEESDLAEEGDRVLADVRGTEVAVFRVEGTLHAVVNFCVHQGGPLCEGELSGEYDIADDGWEWTYDDVQKNVTCPWHGWKFDVRTGESIDDDQYRVPTYDVETENGTVYVVR